MWRVRDGLELLLRTLVLLSGFGNVLTRVINDMEVAAAEPRPVFIEIPKHPVIQSLPLVYEVGTPLSDASEKVEKVLRTPLAFSYNKKKKANLDSKPDSTIVEFYGQKRPIGRSNLEDEDTEDGVVVTKRKQDYVRKSNLEDEGKLIEKAKAIADNVKVVFVVF